MQTINLIKSGALDSIESCSREDIMKEYLNSIADKKERLTLQNMQMLITKELIPDEMSFYAQLFLFNKFLKTCKIDTYYQLNESAINFISNHFNVDIIDNGNLVLQKTWDNLYKKSMEPMRIYLKNNSEEILNALNDTLYQELANKYAVGNISRWEMDALSFYYHRHELDIVKNEYDDFFKLNENPDIDYVFNSKDGQEIKIYQLKRIVGTVIDKDKIKNTINLLTPTGVVTVKIYKNQFALYDKQISEKDTDGVKHVLEKSWFSRGTLLMIQGIRRNNNFIPKKYQGSVYPVISKITNIDEQGNLTFQFERMEVDED